MNTHTQTYLSLPSPLCRRSVCLKIKVIKNILPSSQTVRKQRPNYDIIYILPLVQIKIT